MVVTYRAKRKREVFSLPKLEHKQGKLTVLKFGYYRIILDTG